MVPSIFCIFQLQLAVYYESLCPDSARFIAEQLHPLKRTPLGKYVDVTFVPFGKANVSIPSCVNRQACCVPRFMRAHTHRHSPTFVGNTYIFRCESLNYHTAFTCRQNT